MYYLPYDFLDVLNIQNRELALANHIRLAKMGSITYDVKYDEFEIRAHPGEFPTSSCSVCHMPTKAVKLPGEITVFFHDPDKFKTQANGEYV